MEFLDKIYKKAKKVKKSIIFPEGEEKRIVEAVSAILKLDVCRPVLVGSPEKIVSVSKGLKVDIKNAEIIDISDLKNLDKYIDLYCEIRKHKNVKKDEAKRLITENPVFYSSLAVRIGDVDGFVAGASTTTRDVAKAAIYCIGSSKDTPTVSSSTILILPDRTFGSNGVFIYADAGIVPDPTSEQLRDIAIASVKMANMLLDDDPKVAMLSYSTKGSGGNGKSVLKVREATRLILERYPDMLIDGEVQIDCAVVPEVAERKDPNSKIKGRANIFIFPDLDSGNISYKLTERIGKAYAIGPIIQGLNKPASDLSRGCNAHDILNAASITALLAQAN
ncbi:MAG: phosphate acetyltransferase [Candidatus Omnitrophota bacterium]